MVKFLLPYFFISYFLRPAHDPFTFLGKPKSDVETVIGKSVRRDAVDSGILQCAYPFSKTGSYTVAYVSDTARAFSWQPSKKTVFLKSQLPPFAFQAAPRQIDPSVKLLVSVSEKPKILVELKGDTVRKVTYLP
jgi:hypothetical protein